MPPPERDGGKDSRREIGTSGDGKTTWNSGDGKTTWNSGDGKTT